MAALGCRVNPNYCEGRNANNNCTEPPYPPDGGVDAPPPCESSANCAAPAKVCDLSGGSGTGKCVMCTAQDPSACTGNTCGTDNLCHPCSAHNQCASNVCLPSGECSAETATNVAYVAAPPAGSGTACTRAAPCALLSTALSTKRDYIKVSGTISDNPVVDGTQTVTILADPLAKLTPQASDILLTLTGRSNLTIYDLELSGAVGTAGHAIFMPAGNRSSLTLHRVKILKNSGVGISADGGMLNIFQSTIAENDGGGINMISATTFDIRNNFIVRNGTLSAVAGGVRAIPAGNSKFEFNTVVSNNASLGAVNSAGLACVSSIAAPYNLVFNNSLSGVVTAENQIVVCGRDGSLRAEPQAGAGFADPGANNYHLTASSAAGIRDVVSCSSTAKLIDIDGEGRPKNGQCDIGADEY